MAARVVVVIAPLFLGAIAAMLGVHFQRQSDLARGAAGLDPFLYVDPVKRLLADMSAICSVAIVALAIWSFIVVGNTHRVYHSIRAAWFAGAGWLIAPGLGLAAHYTLDHRLHSGSIIGCSVFLVVLYIPFGTLGGTAKDLGDSSHLARMWYLATAVSAFLLIVGVSGATRLPGSGAVSELRIRAIACYLAAVMLGACAAMALATARNLNAYISHRWLTEYDPSRIIAEKGRARIKRSGRRLRRRMTPTLFLRLIVPSGVVASGALLMAEVYTRRQRALNFDRIGAVAERELALDNLRVAAVRIAVVFAAVHVVYIVWATVASRNAYRRSILAPTPWAVFASFVSGPLIIAAGLRTGGALGDAAFAVGIALSGGGFIVGQLVLGRTVAALGGRGRVFLTWTVLDLATVGIGVFATVDTGPKAQLIVELVALGALSAANAGLAWTMMTRLDRTCREYLRSAADGSANMPVPVPPMEIPAQALVPLSLTSSHN